jgi:pimeloyl-ACP methyl ester carboxylesterase
VATFVLVHGAWHGGWCWKKLTPLLERAGHRVSAPTLTGLGERAHLLSPANDLDTHITDVANLLEFEDLGDVVLVGHSYGGMVISGVAERVGGRVRRLVYLDAFVPEDAQSLYDLLSVETRAAFRGTATVSGDTRVLPPPPLSRWGVTSPEDVAWMSARVRPQPEATFEQSVRLSCPPSRGRVCTYISCVSDQKPHYSETARRVRGTSGWRSRDIQSGHDPFVTHPEQLAALLEEAVRAE